MGGRGSGSGGPSLGGGSGENVNIISTEDVWSYRHGRQNEPFVDAINTGVSRIQNDFPDVMNTIERVEAAEMGGKDKSTTLGVYGGGSVAINKNFTDIDKMNKVYDNAVQNGFHPSRGSRTGTEAVALHETGHALTDHLAGKMGTDLDSAAKTIVDNAYKNAGGRGGTKKWAGGISKYAQKNNAECVAEAVADWYCNGDKASGQSKAIMKELRRVYKS